MESEPQQLRSPKKHRSLPPKQELYCQAFVVGATGVAAVTAAGYTGDLPRQHERLQIQPKIKKRIAEITREHLKNFDVQPQDIISELARIAFSDIRNYLDIGDGQDLRVSLAKITADQARAIASVERTESRNGAVTLKFKLHDKVRSLELLAKNLGLLIDRTQLEAKIALVDARPLTQELLAELDTSENLSCDHANSQLESYHNQSGKNIAELPELTHRQSDPHQEEPPSSDSVTESSP